MASLVDTSIFNALVRYRLFEETMALRRVKRADIFVLRELKYQLADNHDPWGKPILDTATLALARKLCDGLTTVPSHPNESDDRRLLLRKNDNIWHGATRVKVDGGEALIFAATRNVADYAIWTADKKSLIALSKIPDCAHIHRRIIGRVFCLERMIRDLVVAHGFDVMAPKLCPGYHSVDKAVSAGDGCCDILQATEDELQDACGGLLAA